MNLTPKQSTHIELCESCGQPTGNAGVGEDSLFSKYGERGPLCFACSHYEDRVVTPIANERQSLRAQRDALVKALEILIDEADKARECLLSESLVGRFRYAARTRIAIDQAQAALRKFYGVE